ncbi:MAG: type IV conjugative transfer system protein TraL [Gallionellales bacterium CG_4_10_14_3_um_filter_54_96]|nr:MAG: type IV conjugative transfer system protein TraL [Gallionellales bacterium CG03_land_8_20_14_0_80_55_15]PIV91044.1 MAG: type IV conjugative transfer system protein TraL [Gallionellales bacterium CG17_big_fil_post_rev_8_21_14_2_50_54_146]PIX03610.1 MAG: type IV conjugative transfer system protein TraL [Gallionellales bacterium CG_4_8_14_3_um_filter_54_18]PIY05415.1 MAG: type IV conjugative transfer system protein TraL [Gallionellales bacterium CG_4_10_14_3_um_filter_54_96]PJC03277.1 MAG:
MNEAGYIPRTLDQLEKFLLWEVDQFVIAVMIIGVGVSSGMLLSGLVCGGLAAWQYGKLKAGKHPKFAIHTLYWWLPSDVFAKTQVTPPSHIRYFLG